MKKALFQIASRLHDNPSRSQHMLTSALPPSLYPSAGSLMGAPGGAPIFAPIVGSYGGYKAERGDWPRSGYPSSREDSSMKDFSIRFVCPTGNIGGVIGKGGAIINQIRQETRAGIKVDSSSAEGDDCLITISSKEVRDCYLCMLLHGDAFSGISLILSWLLNSILKIKSLQQLKQQGACNPDVVRRLRGTLELLLLQPVSLCQHHVLAA